MDVCIISSNILCIYNIFLSVFLSFHKKKKYEGRGKVYWIESKYNMYDHNKYGFVV